MDLWDLARILHVAGGYSLEETVAPPRTKPRTRRRRAARPRAERRLCCARCGHPLADERDAILAGGKHLHLCVNPGGLLYRIRCFRRAAGCRSAGDESEFWSWFPGYTWQVGVCGACGQHVGWRFQSDADAFWGLIPERLAPGSGEGDQPG